MNLLQMSLSGAAMIFIIVTIRALAIHKLPKKVFILLWGIVLLRLLLPYSLPSAFSVYSQLERYTPPAAEASKDTPAVSIRPISPSVNAAAVPAVSSGSAADDPALSWGALWLLGVLVFALFFAAVYFKCRGEFKMSLPIDNAHTRCWLSEHPLHRSLAIRQSDRISAPLTYGICRPVILVPKTTDWGDPGTLRYVLEHEYVHIRRFDNLTKLALTAAVCVHWFNPAVWVMFVLFNRDMELSCDEAVIRRFGERAKSAYAMALIHMEEARLGLSPLYSHFSRNAIEERIIAIMKNKKPSPFALLTTAALTVGMVFVFATSAQPAEAKGPGHHAVTDMETIAQENTVTSYTSPKDGRTYYSWDGGKTWTAMSDEELEAYYAQSSVEWWTAEEYAAWLEEEKEALQDAIGSRAWTSVDGWFTWTQEKVDETIAMYEGILENIRNGMLYSRTTDGEGELFGIVADAADKELSVYEGAPTAVDFSPYAPYGLLWDEKEKALFFQGQRVRYFLDGVEADSGMAVWLEYADVSLEGEIDVHTVRKPIRNADGSVNPMGPLTGLETYSQAEFDARMFYDPALDAWTYVFQDAAGESEETQERLQAYVPFGLDYEIDPATGELSMSWQGKPVHSVYDAEEGVWIANSMRGLYLGPDAVDLEAVYKQGKLTGLRESDVQTAMATSVTLAEGTAAQPGTSFAARFAKYADCGIEYVEANGASGAGNVYYYGQLVSRFADIAPDGSAFSFTSAKRGGLNMRTFYDRDGRLAGVETVA